MLGLGLGGTGSPHTHTQPSSSLGRGAQRPKNCLCRWEVTYSWALGGKRIILGLWEFKTEGGGDHRKALQQGSPHQLHSRKVWVAPPPHTHTHTSPFFTLSHHQWST